MKKDISLQDFHYLVDLIRERVELTSEERELWEQSLSKVSSQITQPATSVAIVPKKYLSQRNYISRFLNWFKKRG